MKILSFVLLFVIGLSTANANSIKDFETKNLQFIKIISENKQLALAVLNSQKGKEKLLDVILKHNEGPNTQAALGAWLVMDSKTHQIIGWASFKEGNKDNTELLAKEGRTHPEAPGLRYDERTELEFSRTLLENNSQELKSDMLDALISYAFQMEPKLIGIDIGLSEGDRTTLSYLQTRKGFEHFAGPYPVKVKDKSEMVQVYRLDREKYNSQEPFAEITIQ